MNNIYINIYIIYLYWFIELYHQLVIWISLQHVWCYCCPQCCNYKEPSTYQSEWVHQSWLEESGVPRDELYGPAIWLQHQEYPGGYLPYQSYQGIEGNYNYLIRTGSSRVKILRLKIGWSSFPFPFPIFKSATKGLIIYPIPYFGM